MKTRFAIALIGAVLAGGSLTAHAGGGYERRWDGHGPRDYSWHHEDRSWHHHHWRPAPRWHPPGPAYRGYGGYPPPYGGHHDGVTIILRGRL